MFGRLAGSPLLPNTAPSGSPVATYPITASGQTSGNYTIAYVAGTLTVTKASLTVTADDKTKTYAAGNPSLKQSYARFLNLETSASLGGTLSVATTATAASPPATYPLTP